MIIYIRTNDENYTVTVKRIPATLRKIHIFRILQIFTSNLCGPVSVPEKDSVSGIAMP